MNKMNRYSTKRVQIFQDSQVYQVCILAFEHLIKLLYTF